MNKEMTSVIGWFDRIDKATCVFGHTDEEEFGPIVARDDVGGRVMCEDCYVEGRWEEFDMLEDGVER